ncbi:SDR family oxidoreductase [Nocardioides sp. YIM 152315]|uniref:SDR family oxidoreductase n=1 Tax=Nocardioides sp. YIM 152315 TaxID=3031760 RepID=UPI0023DA47FE|nr:SDR family oxidoreductase [Nocardioides sp. YIM 152315]MDF1602032.1 SDR family oxidoreductase [Nocardioides sp. YIM 152315]
MKVVVIGGTGLIGSKVVENLNAHGHEAKAASLQTGVNTITGEGLDQALADAQVVVDVSNSPSFEAEAVMNFFTTATTNLAAAARSAGVQHLVALSVVGADRLPHSDYLRAKVAQEGLIADSGLPYTIVRATQFYEFLHGIADSATADGEVRLPSAYFQPMPADDVADAVCRASTGDPANGIVEVGGPAPVRMSDFVASGLARVGDPRKVIADEHAPYFGTEITDESLVPGPDAVLSTRTYDEWFAANGS